MKFFPVVSHRALVLVLPFSFPVVATLSAAKLPGLPNFQTVNDQVYRGGQPSAEGFRNLAKMGIKTIVDLRLESDDRKMEKKAVSDLGMRYINIPMKGMTTPTEKQISEALKILNDSEDGPVFVHCRLGKDRTGVVIAAYRMQHDGWENKRALTEARSIGMAWYQFPLQRYVMRFEHNQDSGVGIAAKVEESGGGSAGAPDKSVKTLTGAASGVVK